MVGDGVEGEGGPGEGWKRGTVVGGKPMAGWEWGELWRVGGRYAMEARSTLLPSKVVVAKCGWIRMASQSFIESIVAPSALRPRTSWDM